MLQVKARVLPPPTVSYGGNSMVQPDGGAWNLISTAFYEPRHLSDWAIVALTDRGRLVNPRDGEEASLNSFLNDFKQVRGRRAPPGSARRSEDGNIFVPESGSSKQTGRDNGTTRVHTEFLRRRYRAGFLIGLPLHRPL